MNIEYIGVDGAIIDEHFTKPDEMIVNYIGYIKKFFDHVIIPTGYSQGYYYNSLTLDFNNFITAKIQGVYENGVVFEFTCHIDSAACMYDIATSAYLILTENSNPVFIINTIDARCNNKKFGERISGNLLKTNKEKIEEKLSKLGNRIDTDNYIGIRKKENIINRKRLQKKIDLIQEKVKVKVCKSLKKLEKLNEIKKKELR